MNGYSSLEYYYSTPWVETHHRMLKKTSPISLLKSDIDFALTCFESNPFEDFFFSSRNKWLTQMESSFSYPFKAIERSLASEMWASKTIRKQSDGDYSCVAAIQYKQDHVLHDLVDRVAAMEIALNKLTKSPIPLPNSNINNSFKKEWQTENGGKAKFSYKYEAKSPAEGELKTIKTEKFKLSKSNKPQESQIRLIPVEEEDTNNNMEAEASRKIQSVFARKRAATAQEKGKQKELSPMDAALIIQARFREYLVHRSETLRSLRDLAVAKAKLKELRSLFTNYAYRRHLCRDAEEKQRFSEKIIVLLLTVDSIQGMDHLVREARRSMIQELESMLDTIDPQANRASCSKRRRFDLPDHEPVHKEMEMEVADVVGMLDEKNGRNLFPYVTLCPFSTISGIGVHSPLFTQLTATSWERKRLRIWSLCIPTCASSHKQDGYKHGETKCWDVDSETPNLEAFIALSLVDSELKGFSHDGDSGSFNATYYLWF